MSEKTAKALATASGVWVFLYVLVLRTSTSQQDRFRTLGAAALVFIFMALLADVAPEVAGPFALLLAIAVAVRYAQQKGQISTGVKQAGAGAQATAGSITQAIPHF